MERALLVAVRFYEGRYHGAGGWPPAPARVYQALMAGAASGAKVPDAAQRALAWLEQLPAPAIAVPHGKSGQGYNSFVPNNDLDAALPRKGVRDIPEAVASVRVGKNIRPILFDAAAPLLYCWSFEGDEAQATVLCGMAERLYQFGRGVDMAWADAAVLTAEEARKRLAGHGGIVYRPSGGGGGAGRDLLCPQPGTGQSLAARFDGMRTRFRRGRTNRKPVRVFVQPPKPVLASVSYNVAPARLVFALRGNDPRGGFAPWPLRAAAALIAEARDQAAARLCKALPGQADDVMRYLVGRGATDRDKAVRVRIVPLPSIGHRHADMAIRRLMVHVPQSCPLRVDDLAWAFAQTVWTDADGVVLTELQPVEDDAMAARYEREGRHWRSVTPLALAAARRRRIDPARAREQAKGAAERASEEAGAAEAVRRALRHAEVGLSPTAVRVQREPFDGHGERAETFAAGTRFPEQALWHVSMSFAEPVSGPMLLGDGRYLGLGLMRPANPPAGPMPGVLGFTIGAGLAENADPALIAHAARRAMLARMQAALPRGQPIPAYVSGHEADGSPIRRGAHRHVAILCDLPRRRLLFVAPNRLQHGGVAWREFEADHERLERALLGMTELRAGPAGRLALAPAAVEAEGDPLFAPSREWESVSDYRVTRHRRRMTEADALRADAAAELARIGWPEPTAIEILSARRGARGGLSGRLRLVFATAQPGPLAIGSTMHKGGGLFAAPSGTNGKAG